MLPDEIFGLKIGAMQAVVSHEDITKALGNSRFKGKYVLVFPEELSNLIEWDGQDHQTRKGLLQKSDMVFSGQASTIDWCLGRPPGYAAGEEAFKDEFKTLKPCVHGSDAHCVDDIAHPCSKRGTAGHVCVDNPDTCELRHCWIKADPTFEGLRQVLYEPADRVRIQPDSPEPARSSFTIVATEIAGTKINSDLTIEPTKLPLNQGLIAVAGSKGSGKTALVDLIANCYLNRAASNESNSFVYRVRDDKPALAVELRFRDGKQFSKQMLDDSFIDEFDLVYIAQGALEKYLDDKSDFAQYVRNLILDNREIRSSVKSFELEQLRTGHEEILRRLAQKNQQIVASEQKATKTITDALALSQKQRQADLADVNARISEIQRAISAERVQEAQNEQQALSAERAKKGSLTELQALLSQAIEFVDTELPKLDTLLSAINDRLPSADISESMSEASYPDAQKLGMHLAAVREKLIKVVGDIEARQKKLDTYSDEMKSHAALLDKKGELEKQIAQLGTQEQNIGAEKARLLTARGERQALLRGALCNIQAQARKFTEVIAIFAAQKQAILGDLTFEPRITFDEKTLLASAEDVLDNRSVCVQPREQEPSVFETLLDIAKEAAQGKEAAVENYVAEVEKLNELCTSKLKRSRAISAGDLYEVIYGNFFKVSPTVKYKNTDLRKLSLGQKATVLIKIHLAQGDKPIIIDSHDDHLDNEFIMDELVEALRNARQLRQIILVSNNGNVVVNSDADQLVIARRDDKGRISYISGSLEAPTIRKMAVKVLEGGEEAFRQRQRKYRLGN
jgi:energy-coupling factor transporter ATP-binding protein EcfA2